MTLAAADLPFGIVVRAMDPERMGVTLPPLMESLELSGVPAGVTSVISEPLVRAAHHADLPRWIVYLHDATAVGKDFLRKAGDVYKLLSEAPAAARVGCATLTSDVPFGVYDTVWLKTLDPATEDDAIATAGANEEDVSPVKSMGCKHEAMGDFRYAADDPLLAIQWFPSLDVYRMVETPAHAPVDE